MIYPGPSLGRAPPESVFKSGSPPKTTRLSECVDSRGQEGVVFTILGLCPVARALDLSLHDSRALGFWGIHFLYPKTSLHGSESRGCSSGPLKADMIPRGQGLGLFTVTSNPFCRGGFFFGSSWVQVTSQLPYPRNPSKRAIGQRVERRTAKARTVVHLNYLCLVIPNVYMPPGDSI